MSTQNVTIKLDKKLLEEVRMLAAFRSVSLSEFFADFSRTALAADPAFRKRRKRFLARLEKGLDLGSRGRLRDQRGDLHARDT